MDGTNALEVLQMDQFERQTDASSFYCNILSHHLKEHRHIITRPHKHNFFLTVVFTAGEGTHDIDFSQYKVQAGSVFMMAPGQVHCWTLSADAEGYIFFHSQEFFDGYYSGRSVYQFPFFHSTQNTPAIQLQEGDTLQLEERCREMYMEYQQDQDLRYAKLVALTDLVYLDLSRWYKPELDNTKNRGGPYHARIQELWRLVDAHFAEHKSPAYYADRMHITTKHLNRMVKSSLGKTSSDLIMDRVLLEAKRQLMNQKISLAQIADILGYVDYAYFSRLFKARTGLTPKTFRSDYAEDKDVWTRGAKD